ncbi:MAG TPA: hypothetical protein VMQ51_14695, partial [Candidatus Binatia bacterium]|nr:hypothetical protein [Candidatus Binatia bacterium]
MAHPETLDRLVRRVAAQVRRRRVEHYALKAAFWASWLSVGLLLFKQPLGAPALPLAGGVLAAGALGGALWGALRRTPTLDAARLADRAWGLEDRVATALEWAARPDRTPMVDALLADATARVEQLEARMAARRVIPRDGRFLPIPLALAVALALAPPVPLPSGRLPDFSATAGEEPTETRADTPLMEDRAKPLAKDRLKPSSFEERDFATRAGGSGGSMSGDLSAIFKDTALSSQRPDFQSFLKKGDERLKLLEQADRLPDLQSDFTASQYKMVYRKSKALTSGLRPDISPQKLKELLEEMERLGRKGGANWQGDAAEGMEAMEGGQTDRAMEAMQRALDKMRAQDEARHSGKNLKGGRESSRSGAASRDRRGAGEGGGPEDQDFGEGEGMLPGKGRSA